MSNFQQIPTPFLEAIIQEHYSINCTLKALTGYDELNFIARLEDDTNAVVKVVDQSADYSFLDAQFQLSEYLQKTAVHSIVPFFFLAKEGKGIVQFSFEGKDYYLRILSYLQGTFLTNIQPTPNLLSDFGHTLAQLDQQMIAFTHPALVRSYAWDVSNTPLANQHLRHIADHEKRRIVGYFLLQYDMEVVPNLPFLRKSAIHSDANDANVLVDTDNDTVSGIIDFGDMVYSHLINNLAIACTYVMMQSDEPLQAASHVVKAYNARLPLTETEVDLLYYLIAGRLCISVTQSAHQRSLSSENTHHFVSEERAWSLLEWLLALNPLKAKNEFRTACHFDSVYETEEIQQQLRTERKAIIGRNLSVSYKDPLTIHRSALQYLYDDRGNTYIDCVNNVSHVGHCHPVVVRSMQKQLARLNTNTRYLHSAIVAYATELLKTLPENLKVCYFVNSGSEANDLAIRISRHFTKQQDTIVLDHAYHGTSTTAIELSPYKFDAPGGIGQRSYIHKAQNPDSYRGIYTAEDPECGKKYASDVQRIVEELHRNGKAPAAFICETLLGVGGQIPLPKGYLKEVYRIIREAGGICIADEVQVGFGRVGDTFWGFELQDVQPDMVVIGKPAGNGHPLAAVIMTEELAASFANGPEYFNTFGGNPVSMCTGLSVLKVIQDEEMQAHAKEIGEYLLSGFKLLQSKYPAIGDVRGHGLFIGVELVEDRQTKKPAIELINAVVHHMKEEGFLLSTDGPLNNVLKIKPPLVFSKKNAEKLVFLLDKTLNNVSSI